MSFSLFWSNNAYKFYHEDKIRAVIVSFDIGLILIILPFIWLKLQIEPLEQNIIINENLILASSLLPEDSSLNIKLKKRASLLTEKQDFKQNLIKDSNFVKRKRPLVVVKSDCSEERDEFQSDKLKIYKESLNDSLLAEMKRQSMQQRQSQTAKKVRFSEFSKRRTILMNKLSSNHTYCEDDEDQSAFEHSSKLNNARIKNLQSEKDIAKELLLQTAEPLSLSEIFSYPRVQRYITLSLIFFLKFELCSLIYNLEFLRIYSEDPDHHDQHRKLDLDTVFESYLIIGFNFLTAVLLIGVGYASQKWFIGRKIKLLYIIVTITIFIDIFCIVMHTFRSYLNEYTFVYNLKVQGLFTILLYYYAQVILPIDLGKIAFLKHKLKFFGALFGLLTACDLFINTAVSQNLIFISHHTSNDVESYIYLTLELLISIVVFGPLLYGFYQEERQEIENLQECQKQCRSIVLYKQGFSNEDTFEDNERKSSAY
eukprot:403346251